MWDAAPPVPSSFTGKAAGEAVPEPHGAQAGPCCTARAAPHRVCMPWWLVGCQKVMESANG